MTNPGVLTFKPKGRNYPLIEAAIGQAIASVHVQVLELLSAYDPSGRWNDPKMDERTAVHALRGMAMQDFGAVLHFIDDVPDGRMHPRHKVVRGILRHHAKFAPDDPVRYVKFLLTAIEGCHNTMMLPANPKSMRVEDRALSKAHDIGAETIRRLAQAAK